MTPEQKQIAIAEWEGIPTHKVFRMKFKDTEWFDHKVPLKIPPYLTSRDAICGAVARLGNLEKGKFVDHLISLDSMSTDSLTFNLITATPAQMADALLLTLGYEI